MKVLNRYTNVTLHTNNTCTDVKVFEALVKMKQALVIICICMLVCSLESCKRGMFRIQYNLYQMKKYFKGTITRNFGVRKFCTLLYNQANSAGQRCGYWKWDAVWSVLCRFKGTIPNYLSIVCTLYFWITWMYFIAYRLTLNASMRRWMVCELNHDF